MQYVGGKQKSGGHHIAAVIKHYAKQVSTPDVVEPMCGGLSVTSRLKQFAVHARDACVPLIALYRAMQQGWLPPAEVTRAEWLHYKAVQDPHDPMTAFVGFGCSRSGAWFSAYINDYKYTDRRVPAATAARDSLFKKLEACAGVEFVAGDYADAPVRGVWYCDIPYAGTLGYPAVGPFDHARFWSVAENVSVHAPVIVSERAAPAPFVAIAEWSVQSRLNTPGAGRRMERLFVHECWAYGAPQFGPKVCKESD
jgi:DNA adenine methylase